jgi:hypothetical protein
MGLSTDGYIVHSYSVFGAAMPKKPLPRFNPVEVSNPEFATMFEAAVAAEQHPKDNGY